MNALFKYAAALLFVGTSIADADERTQTFLKTHCISCHGPQKQKADRRFDTLPARITKLHDLERYQEIVDLLNLGEMPPEDETQPTPAEVAAAWGLADPTSPDMSGRCGEGGEGSVRSAEGLLALRSAIVPRRSSIQRLGRKWAGAALSAGAGGALAGAFAFAADASSKPDTSSQLSAATVLPSLTRLPLASRPLIT